MLDKSREEIAISVHLVVAAVDGLDALGVSGEHLNETKPTHRIDHRSFTQTLTRASLRTDGLVSFADEQCNTHTKHEVCRI